LTAALTAGNNPMMGFLRHVFGGHPMNSTPCPYTIEIVTDPVELAKAQEQRQRYERNYAWLEAHATEVFSHRGRCVCIAGQQLFVAETASEAWALGAAAHPEDNGMFVRYIPLERVPRIYANERLLVGL
jgi:hypothetical protein